MMGGGGESVGGGSYDFDRSNETTDYGGFSNNKLCMNGKNIFVRYVFRRIVTIGIYQTQSVPTQSSKYLFEYSSRDIKLS